MDAGTSGDVPLVTMGVGATAGLVLAVAPLPMTCIGHDVRLRPDLAREGRKAAWTSRRRSNALMVADDRKDIAYWRERIQDYLDGSLPRRDAVQLFLHAERHPELRAELDAFRQLMADLDALPREEPDETFDARVLASVPLERYVTAPRKPEAVLTVGAQQPGLLAAAVARLRNGATALAVAYGLFLVVSHSFLAEAAATATGAIGEWLGVLVARTQGVPVLSALVGGTAQAFDLGTGAFAALAGAWGPLLTVLATGAAVALAGVGFRRRRKQVARGSHA